ncbi:MAG: hypothetical protein HDR04_07725 [Lachnospiraceae bacterium]|nr:hypothetical protein [Lachnospiraceae bacterium]
MINNIRMRLYNSRVEFVIKNVLIVAMIFFFSFQFNREKLDLCYSYRDYAVDENAENLQCIEYSINGLSQKFVAKGNILSSVYIYLNDVTESNGELEIVIKDNRDVVVHRKIISMGDYRSENWNRIDLGMSGLKRGKVYSFEILSNTDILTNISLENNNQSVFLECLQNGQRVQYILNLGLQFTYRYLSLGNFIVLTLNGIFIICMIAILSYAIYNMKKIYREFIVSEKKQGFAYALSGALSVMLLFNPLDQIATEVSKFNRVFGAGFIRNYDVSKVIHNFEVWFLIFTITFSLLFLLINYKKKEWGSVQDKRYEIFLDNLIILALTMQLLRCFNFFYDESVSDNIFYYSVYLLGLWIFFVGLIITTRLNKIIDYETLIRTLVISFSEGFPIAIFISETWQSGKILIGVQAILICLNLTIVYFAKLKNFFFFDKVYSILSLLLAFVPFLTSVYIELVHILNQHGIFVTHLKTIYVLMSCLYIILFTFVSLIFKSKSLSFQKWREWAFGGIILGVSSLGVQIPLQQIIEGDIYESANCSVLVSDWLNFGSIPIVEHYGGHMMQGVWEGIIYALLNNDYHGAILSPYRVYIYPVLAILFFLLLKNVWDEDIAVWAVLLIPFYNNFGYFGLGLLVCTTTVAYVRKKTWFRAFGIWLAVAWCVIYRLDLGFAFAFASIIALILYVIKQRDLRSMKQLGISFVITVSSGGAVWFFLCVLKNIDPFKRIREFIEISASNQNWAFYGIGDSSKAIFAWCYIIVPLIVALCTIYIVFSQKILKKVSIENWIMLLILGVSYFCNFQRGLTRHSLIENATTGILWCSLLFIAIFFALYLNRNYLCIPFFIVLVICNTVFIQDGNYTEQNIVDTATIKLDNFIDTWTVHQMRFGSDENEIKTYWEELSDKKEKVNRVINTLDNEILSYQKIMDLLLQDNETYIDFMTRSFVYSAIGRRCPVYVAQSPIMLSGEYSQERFVSDIQADIDNIPLAILPITDSRLSIGYDGIANAYRYYKVSEFIYKNYRPLCSNGEFAVWCLKDRYEDMLNKLEFAALEADLDSIIELPYYDCTILQQTGGIQVTAIDIDPRIEDLQAVIDLHEVVGVHAKISVEYQIDHTGYLQLFYTTDEGESYSEEKSCVVEVSDEGVAEFQIYVTENTKLRLDMPTECTIKINKIVCGINQIDWGYDGNTVSIDEYGNINYSYYSQLHNYELDQLPRIWAEKDTVNAIGNKTMYTTNLIGNTYVLSGTEFNGRRDECYLLLTSNYSGQDIGGKYKSDDESMRGVVCLGWYDGDMFVEKCRYFFTMQEGEHDYLFRISTDYFWHLGEINALQFYTDYDTNKTKIRILEGD